MRLIGLQKATSRKRNNTAAHGAASAIQVGVGSFSARNCACHFVPYALHPANAAKANPYNGKFHFHIFIFTKRKKLLSKQFDAKSTVDSAAP